MPTQTPLWKQILGAVGGAAVAVVVYQAFLFLPSNLKALVTLPSAPGVSHQTGAQFGSEVDETTRLRQESRNREIAEDLGFGSASSAALHGAAGSSSSSSRSVAAGLQGIVNATRALLTSSSSSAVSHSSAASSHSSIPPVRAAQSASSAASRAATTVVTKSVPPIHAERLPNSGVGSLVIAAAAFGATVSRRMQKRRA